MTSLIFNLLSHLLFKLLTKQVDMKYLRTLILYLSLLSLITGCEGISCFVGYGESLLPYNCNEDAAYRRRIVCATSAAPGVERLTHFCYQLDIYYQLTKVEGCYTYFKSDKDYVELCLCDKDFCNTMKKKSDDT